VPLGLLNVDENTTEGMLQIIDKLKRYECPVNSIVKRFAKFSFCTCRYAPVMNDTEKVPIVAFGDGLSTDRCAFIDIIIL